MDAESRSLFLRLLEAEASPTCRSCKGPKSRTDTVWCNTCLAAFEACPQGDRRHYVGQACPSCGWARSEVLEES